MLYTTIIAINVKPVELHHWDNNYALIFAGEAFNLIEASLDKNLQAVQSLHYLLNYYHTLCTFFLNLSLPPQACNGNVL